MSFVEWAEKGFVPDFLIRAGIRSLLRQRLDAEWKGSEEATQENLRHWRESLKASPVAVQTDISKSQHYEVPTEFFVQTLGPRLKYSSCYFPEGVSDLAQAESQMLKLTCERAHIQNGMKILELGCGWGSLSLWLAGKFPQAEITAVSHSKTQKDFIDARARAQGLRNLKIVTQDMNDFATNEVFDRVVSVEMFEHMRNWEELFRRISRWLKPEGLFFMHIFCHKRLAYFFEEQGDDNWMGQYFFSGGIMPSRDLPFQFSKDLSVIDHWVVDGRHYAETAEAWLRQMDNSKKSIMSAFANNYGADSDVWFQRWRMFFMACAELFAFNEGQEWFVGHYLLKSQRR